MPNQLQRSARILLGAQVVSFLFFLCSCSSSIESPCTNCGGKGTVWYWSSPKTWIDPSPCPVCAGTGISAVSEFNLIKTTMSIVVFILIAVVVIGGIFWITELAKSKGIGIKPRGVFIIGPEGAGKTVFLAALSRFADAHSDEIVFEPIDFGSSQYVANSLQLLDCGKWPKSNPLGDLKTFKWKIGKVDGPMYEISLFDYSGQDMRSTLLEDDAEKLEGRPRGLREEIDHADLLIYLLDVDGLLGGGSLLETNENCWLLRAFLTRPSWMDTHRILVLTKADLYTELIEEAGGDIRAAIGRQLSGSVGGTALSRQLGTVKCLSLTSVKTRTKLVDDSQPVREPTVPIESEGFEPLIQAILAALEAAETGETQFS